MAEEALEKSSEDFCRWSWLEDHDILKIVCLLMQGQSQKAVANDTASQFGGVCSADLYGHVSVGEKSRKYKGEHD
jgi:hypothetical protein